MVLLPSTSLLFLCFSLLFFVFLLPNFLIAYKSGGFSSYAKTRAFFFSICLRQQRVVCYCQYHIRSHSQTQFNSEVPVLYTMQCRKWVSQEANSIFLLLARSHRICASCVMGGAADGEGRPAGRKGVVVRWWWPYSSWVSLIALVKDDSWLLVVH